MNPHPKASSLRRCGANLLALGLALVASAALAGRSKAAVVEGELLVKLRSGDALPGLLVRHQLTLADRLGARPMFRLRTVGNVKLSDKVKALQLEPDVLIAEPNAVHIGPEAAKNNYWAIGTESTYVAQWAPAAMRLPAALTMADGRGVRVAVLDTGVDRTHPLLAPRLLPGWDFVDNDADPSEVGSRSDVAYGHGTHVAGLVALAAPGAQIMPVRVLDRAGMATAWTLAAGMLHAVDPDGNPGTNDGAQVINLSLSGTERTRLLDSVALLATCGTPDPTIAADDLSDPGYGGDAARCAGFGGAVVVAAAGNSASGSLREYPAAEGAYGLVAVAASAPGGLLAEFSNSGSWIQLAAPGEGITSAVPGGGYGTWSGTSMAAPLVAGTAALLRSMVPAMTATDSVRCLTRYTHGLEKARFGELDAWASLRAAADRPDCR